MTDIEFRPAAAKDLEEAAQWYEAQQSGLGGEFLEEVQTALNAIVALSNFQCCTGTLVVRWFGGFPTASTSGQRSVDD